MSAGDGKDKSVSAGGGKDKSVSAGGGKDKSVSAGDGKDKSAGKTRVVQPGPCESAIPCDPC